MLKKILIFEFNRPTEDVASDYELLSDIDKEKIAHLDTDAHFDWEDEFSNYHCCFIISEIQFQNFENVLKNNFIPYLCKDITKNVINNNINLSQKLSKYITSLNKKNYNEFIQKIDEFIIQNLELDIILDMINEKGIDSLRIIDKDYLRNYEKH